MSAVPKITNVKSEGGCIKAHLQNDGTSELPQGHFQGIQTNRDGTIKNITVLNDTSLPPGAATTIAIIPSFGESAKSIRLDEYVATRGPQTKFKVNEVFEWRLSFGWRGLRLGWVTSR